MARMSIHDQAHYLTVKRLGHVDSYYVSPFCKVRSYVIPRKDIILRTKYGQYLISLGATTSTEPFFLREYGSRRCSSNFL